MKAHASSSGRVGPELLDVCNDMVSELPGIHRVPAAVLQTKVQLRSDFPQSGLRWFHSLSISFYFDAPALQLVNGVGTKPGFSSRTDLRLCGPRATLEMWLKDFRQSSHRLNHCGLDLGPVFLRRCQPTFPHDVADAGAARIIHPLPLQWGAEGSFDLRLA
jgi:hypothetical protein